MLDAAGGIECDVTVTRPAADRFSVVSAAAAETHDLDWIARHVPDGGRVHVENVTERHGVLTLAGPRSRDLLARLTAADVSGAALPFLAVAALELAGVPARVLRLSYAGELGYELHHPIERSPALYAAVLAAGDGLGLVDFGYRALDAMRLEKTHRLWGADIDADHTPLEVPHGGEAVLAAGAVAGYVSAGGYGHCVGCSIALAYLPRALLASGAELAVDVLGETVPARAVDGALWDPSGARQRA